MRRYYCRKESQKPQNFASTAPEARKIIAHGETVGWIAINFRAPAGAAENQSAEISVAPSGALFVIALGPTAEALVITHIFSNLF
jgi:hypothetical protein